MTSREIDRRTRGHRVRPSRTRRRRGKSLAIILGISLILAQRMHAQDPFIDTVISFTPGIGAGFGADLLPGIVMGPPRGGGALQGSLDVVSLGNSGVIIVGFDLPVICDGPGPDFTVFENAFHSGSPTGPIFAEYGIVAVSQDGVHFVELPYDPVTHAGLAGQTPVLSNPNNGIDPLDPSVSGGDTFDLATVGLAWAAYVRITDPGAAIPDPGNLLPPGTSGGFDLDAIAALHACDPAAMTSPTPSETATPSAAVPSPTSTPTPSATPSPLRPTATPTITQTPAGAPPSHDAAVATHRPVRLKIPSGQPSATKRFRVTVRNADSAGNAPIRLTATGCGPVVDASVDFERRITGAQDTAMVRAGAAKAAVVSVTVSGALVATPNRHEPARCLLTFTVASAVPGNVDPTPADNTATVELIVLDVNDVE